MCPPQRTPCARRRAICRRACFDPPALPACRRTSKEYKLYSLGDDDEELIAKGVHLGLQKNQMIYLDNWSKARGQPELFAEMREMYKASYSLEPEHVAWSDDEKHVYLNLQDNNAVVKVSLDDGDMSVHSYGLKDWSASGGTDGIDLKSSDEECNLKHYNDFKTLRQPKQVATFTTRGGAEYMITAEEGNPKQFLSYPPDGKSDDVDVVYKERVPFKTMYTNGAFQDKYRRWACGMHHSHTMHFSCCITHAFMHNI